MQSQQPDRRSHQPQQPTYNINRVEKLINNTEKREQDEKDEIIRKLQIENDRLKERISDMSQVSPIELKTPDQDRVGSSIFWGSFVNDTDQNNNQDDWRRS